MSRLKLEPIPVDPVSQAKLFLRTLTAGAPADKFMEFRLFSGGKLVDRWWPEAATISSHAQQAVERSAHADVFVGVLPRDQQGVGGKEGVTTGRMLWADCDSTSALEAVMTFSPAPPLVVESSPGHAHCYWMLAKHAPVKEIEDGNARLVEALGADPKCREAARILRVPGTFNHKAAYGQPAPVRIVRYEPTRAMPLEVIVGGLHLPAAEPRPERRSFTRPDHPVGDDLYSVLKGFTAEEYVTSLTGRQAIGNHVHCPFHADGRERTPSLHIRGTNDTLWHCFGCDQGGDIFKFAALLYGMSTDRDFPALMKRLRFDLLASVGMAA